MSSPGAGEGQIAAASIWPLVKLRSEAGPHRILAVDEKARELT
jgi:hypothetical protein